MGRALAMTRCDPLGAARFSRENEERERDCERGAMGRARAMTRCDPLGAAGFSRENGERESLLEARWIAPRLRSGATALGRAG